MIGQQKYGPYDDRTIIQMIQTQQLMDYSSLLADHLEDWTPIYNIEEFSSKRVQHFYEKDSAAFIKRKSRRVEIKIPVVGHNSLRFFEGEVISLSENGALCLLNTETLKPGAQVKVQLQTPELTFNIECEVIRKNHLKQKSSGKHDFYYAVKFNEIQPAGITQIKKWISAA